MTNANSLNSTTVDFTISGQTPNNVPYFTTGGLITSATLTDGQLLIGATGAAPAAAGLTKGTGIDITTGANTITISAIGGGFTWSSVGADPAPAVSGHGYFVTSAITFTLPTDPAEGDSIAIVCSIGANVVVTSGGTNVINIGSNPSSGPGTATSTGVGDAIILVADGSHNWWTYPGVQGNWTLA